MLNIVHKINFQLSNLRCMGYIANVGYVKEVFITYRTSIRVSKYRIHIRHFFGFFEVSVLHRTPKHFLFIKWRACNHCHNSWHLFLSRWGRLRSKGPWPAVNPTTVSYLVPFFYRSEGLAIILMASCRLQILLDLWETSRRG